MKKYLFLLALLFLFPHFASANFPSGWQASTTPPQRQTSIWPARINGVDPQIRVDSLMATSTATSSVIVNASTTQITSSGSSFLATLSGMLGVGTGQPAAKTHIVSTTQQLRVAYDASNYWSHTIGSTGALSLQGVGTGGALNITPTAGQNINITTSGAGDIAINTSGIYFDSSTGFVGIGTLTPDNKLQITTNPNSSGVSYFSLEGSGGTIWHMCLDDDSVNKFYIGGGDCKNQYAWSFNWNSAGIAHNTFQNPNNNASALTVFNIQRHNAGDSGAYLKITTNGGTMGDIFTVDGSGNFGLGTTTPATKVQEFSTATTTLSIDSNHATRGACLELKDRDGSGYSYLSVANGVLTTSATSCK